MTTDEPVTGPEERPVHRPDQPLTPPTIQPHGLFVVLREPDLTIEQISANVQDVTGIPARDLCGRSLDALLPADEAHRLCAMLRSPQLNAVNPRDLTIIDANGHPRRVECTVARRDGGGLFIELEFAGGEIARPVYTNVQAPIERLQTAVDVAALLASAARDIAAISGFDRVLIYRLESDWHGVVVAEAEAPGREREYLGSNVPAADFPEESRAAYLRNPLRIVPDTAAVPVAIVAADDASPEPLDLTRVALRGVAPSALAFLRNMGCRAVMTISVIVRGRLWGLIGCYNEQPLQLNYAKRALCELMGHMLAWQLGARIETERQERRAREDVLQSEIGVELEAHQDVVPALLACAPQLLELFGAQSIAIRSGSTVSTAGGPELDDEQIHTIARTLLERAGNTKHVVVSHELAADVANLAGTRTAPAGALCIRFAAGPDCLLLFRPQTPVTIVWGGAPPAAHDTPPESRRESIAGRSRPWTADDLAAAQTLAASISTRVHYLARTPADAADEVGNPVERTARVQALVGLQHDVAAALPSRAAVIEVVLQFALRATGATGSVLETLGETDIVYEAATGSLAAHVGLHVPRADSFSGMSADLHQPLVCDDATTELRDAERELCERLQIASMLVVPITLSTTSKVALKVVAAQPFAFSDDDAQTLKAAATNLLSALRAAHEFTALAASELEQRTYARQLRALHAIASTTTSHRREQIDAALRLGLEQLGLDWAFLGVIDYATQEFVIENSVSADGATVIATDSRMPLGKTIIARVALSKRVIIVDDVAKFSEPPLYSGWNSYIAVPLFIGGANYGAIGFTSREVRSEPFSEANIEFLAVAGELIGSAIERGLQRDALELSQNRYRALIEAIPQMMWVIDAESRFEYVNERWTQYTGLTLEASRAVGRDGVYHFADVDAAGLGRTLPPVEFDWEVRLRRADGAYRWHLVRSVPFRSVGSAGDAWLVTATDIEARKSAETLLADVHDAALAATEAKSRFLATMSHEIRTPMNGVIGMTELLLLTPLNDEQREYTEVIRDSGQSLLRVLNDILDYSKIEAGKLQLETVQFDLPGQVESVVELLRPGFTVKGVDLTTRFGPDVRTTVVGDPGRLRQILLNLTGNALKFTPAGGTVELDVSMNSSDESVSDVRFTIKDSGIGIPPDVVERLFQPFSQGDESTTRKYGGTGLGLSISAELVALMDGEIGVESEPGVGSEFWFIIPLRLAPNSQKVADAHARSPKRSEPVALRTERILLVEDNEINTFLALKQLQRLGFAVTAVTNGRQAVETVARENYDLVFMDCHMPEMDGFEATRAIRKREAGGTAHLPIVAMTADARDEDHQNCLLAGMDDYMSKPTNLDNLRAVLDRWLPAPERRRATRNSNGLLSSAPTLGMSMLLELFNGDRAAVLDLLNAAMGSINGDLKRIEAAAERRDFDAVIEAAHRLKGTSGSIRSSRLAEISSAIEAEARTAPAVMSATLLSDVRAAVVAVWAEVQQQRKAPDSSSAR